MAREPALTAGTLSAFVAALIALAIAFGLEITQEQQNAILGLIPILFGVIIAVSAIIRGLVFSPKTVQRLELEAYGEGMTNTPLSPAGSPPSGT